MAEAFVTTGQIWIDPDGIPLYVGFVSYSPTEEATVCRVRQDREGKWQPDGIRHDVSLAWLRAACTYQPPPELIDPRISRLTTAVETLLAEYTATASGEAPPTPEHARQVADEIRAALTDVAAIPDQERGRRYQAGVRAARAARRRRPRI
ncbi:MULTISPECIES: hypothetical protein [unclassified Streptomyces]|uniref:hypothetical protein n=1 Tax=unclassified Streptomyces TaxID=2593676 RepID=UPI00341D9C33